MAATAKIVDMTDVKEGGQFNKKRIESGDYLARVVKADDAKIKKQGSDNYGADQWVFTIQIVKVPSAKYPYYTPLVPNQLWKVRNLAVAAGIVVPKKRYKVDPNKIVGKLIGVSVEDTEYDGRDQSEITGVFPASELDDYTEPKGSAAEVDEEVDEDEEEEPEPAPRRTKKRAPEPEPEPEEDEEEDEEDEEPAGDAFDAMDRNELKTYLKTADSSFVAKKSQSDDDLRVLARAVDAGEDEDDEDEEEEPPPPPKKRAAKKAAKPTVTDDELDELDLDDLD